MSVGAAIAASAAVGLFSSSKAASAQKKASKSQADSTAYSTDATIAAAREVRDEARPNYQNAFWQATHGAEDAFRESSGDLAGARDRAIAGTQSAYRDAVDATRGAGESAINATVGAGDEAVRRLDAANADTQGAYSPYAQAGVNALWNLTNGNFQADPGYQFRLNQGTSAIEASRAASGGLFSGATGKALGEYGQNFASNEYGNWWDRQSGLADRGMSATGAMADSRGRTASAVGGVRMDVADRYSALRTGMEDRYAGYRLGEAQRVAGYDTDAARGIASLRSDKYGTINNAGWDLANGISGIGADYSGSAGNAFANYSTGMSSAYANQGNAASAQWAGLAQTANQGINNYLGYKTYQDYMRPQAAANPQAMGARSTSYLW